ncbi:unnamed protein product [Effrenium voratum]|uniref:Uncharacterized protein n=1 Tax=Effrenium voratum TaxID=2562239 RepID=A0AA36JL49_9DINO|nr:unnamed protein product [Effrenium voratum]
MAMMRTRTKSRGMCLCLLGIALALLVQPSTDFARGVPGLKEHAKRHPLHAGVARRAGAAQEDNSGQDRRDLEEVISEAERVLNTSATKKDMQVVMRRFSSTLVAAGKWNDLATKPELKQQLKKFVAEAKAALKALEEDLLLARQQQVSAQRQVETAQQQVEMVMKSLVKAAARLEKAEESGTKEEVKEAKEEVKEAKEEVEKAERKVERAKKEVERAKKEVKEAKASGRTKESEDDPDATAFIQELVNAKPKDLGEGVQVFDLKTCLPAEPYDLSGRKLLTRNTTRQAWQATFELLKNGTRRVAMLGIPGIGKSRSLALGLWHLVSGERPEWIKTPEAIVYEAREGLKVFIFTNKDGDWKAQSIALEDWKPGSCEHLQVKYNWYLVDTYGKETTGKLPAKTVKACSPDREHYSNFIKDGGHCVYVEAWQKGELKVAYPCFEDVKVSESTLLDRFEQVGGTLRTLLAKEGSYEDAVKQQKTDAKDFATVRRALGGDLDSIGTKLPSRLFTFRTENGISCTVAVCSPKARELLAQEHYAELVNLWKDESDPKSRYWLEEFVGVWLTTSWCDKRLEPWMITYAGKWEHKKGKDLVVPALKLLHCDVNDIFNSRWLQAVKRRGTEKCLVHSPERYPGIDYLLDFNHGISVTLSPKHSIAEGFAKRLRDIFKDCKGQHSFTLTFLAPGAPSKFVPSAEFNRLMALAQGPDRVFQNVYVQAVQIPKTLDSLSEA